MDILCENCGGWFRDDCYRWEYYHECPECGAWDASEVTDEPDPE